MARKEVNDLSQMYNLASVHTQPPVAPSLYIFCPTPSYSSERVFFARQQKTHGQYALQASTTTSWVKAQ